MREKKWREIVGYLYSKHPSENKLSDHTIINFLYLCDWKSAITCGKTITELNWQYCRKGLVADKLGQINKISKKESNKLKEKKLEVVDFVIDTINEMTESKLNQLVYSTYPIMAKKSYGNLNIVKKAKEYLHKRSKQ